jgi:MSHA pilin protein MshD
MIIAIVIISGGLAGVMVVLNNTVYASANPMVAKQMQAVAEEMMEEILLKPYAVSGTAPVNTLKACSAAPSRSAFDDVLDYNGYQTTGICDIDGAAIAGLEGHNLAVTVTSGPWQTIASTLTVQVTVTRSGQSISLNGLRTGYAEP